jgi:hypothetical protein
MPRWNYNSQDLIRDFQKADRKLRWTVPIAALIAIAVVTAIIWLKK